MEQLSNTIRRFRFENGEMTQKALAEQVGISRQTMNAIENCQHAPKIDVAIRIADVFGVSVGQLFKFNYDGKPERRPNSTAAAPTQPAFRTNRALRTSIERAEATEPVDRIEQSSAENKPETKISLTDLRKVVG